MEQWTNEKMNAIFTKEKEDMKKGSSRSISVVTIQGSGSQKRNTPSTASSNEKKSAKNQNTDAKGNGKYMVLVKLLTLLPRTH